jgi:hypothetical protein
MPYKVASFEDKFWVENNGNVRASGIVSGVSGSFNLITGASGYFSSGVRANDVIVVKNVAYPIGTISPAASITIDFNEEAYRKLTVNQNMSLTGANYFPAKTVNLLLSGAGSYTVTCPYLWKFTSGMGVGLTGEPITGIHGGEFALLSLTSWGYSDDEIVATYSKPIVRPDPNLNITYLTDLVAYYALEDNTDSHSNNYTLTENTVNYSAGFNNNAADFAAGELYNNTDFDFNSKSYTISAWIKGNDVTVGCSIFGWVAFGGTVLRQAYTASSKLDFFHYDGSWKGINSATTLSDNTWYHVVIRYNSSTQTMSLFINGNKEDTGSVGVLTASSSPYLNIGAENSSNYFNGLIDEFAVWYRALSDSEVSNLYNGGAGLFYGSF